MALQHYVCFTFNDAAGQPVRNAGRYDHAVPLDSDVVLVSGLCGERSALGKLIGQTGAVQESYHDK